MPNEYLCETASTGNCDFTKNKPYGTLLLPACVSEQQENCVDSLIVIEGETPYPLTFTRQVQGPTVKADKKVGLFEGSTVSLWQLPSEYQGTLSRNFAAYSALTINGFQNGRFLYGDFSVNVNPYVDLTGAGYRQIGVSEFRWESGRNGVSTNNGNPACVFTEEGVCGLPQDLPEDVRITYRVRLTNDIGGWFRGRMQETAIAISSFSKTASLVEVSGRPVSVPTLGFAIPQSAAPQGFVDEVKKLAPAWIGGVINTRADQPGAWTYLKMSRDLLNDSASGLISVWNFGSTASAGNACISDKSKVLGIVTTNSTVYQPGAPSYSKGFLNYKVGGLHYQPDGENVFEGSYDLVMRSEVARCLYGFTKAPVSATISVSGAGDKSVATTVVSEKNGWLKLAAYGFTFSEKTLKVKLSQKKTTISCVSKTDMKKTKKVTGYSPNCPKGYKKK